MLITKNISQLIADTSCIPYYFVYVTVRVSINPVFDWACGNIVSQFYRKCTINGLPLNSGATNSNDGT